MWKDFEKNAMIWGTNFLWFALIMVVGVVVVRLLLIPIRKALKMSKGEHTAKTFAFSVIRVTLYGAVVITALGTAGVNITSLITALGAAALTAGLAFQDILKNFLSGMILLFTKPITAGDLIEVDGFEGFVDSIRIFYTQIHTFENKTVMIPNSRLTTGSVVNCSTAGTRRVTLKYAVSYDDSLTQVKSVIYGVIAENPLIIPDPQPKVYISDHLDSGVEITVFVWVKQEDYYPVLFGMYEDVKNAFDENGITIPYPHVQLVSKNE